MCGMLLLRRYPGWASSVPLASFIGMLLSLLWLQLMVCCCALQSLSSCNLPVHRETANSPLLHSLVVWCADLSMLRSNLRRRSCVAITLTPATLP